MGRFEVVASIKALREAGYGSVGAGNNKTVVLFL